MDFNGALVVNADRITPRKSIVVCGVARGGTSFGASVFVRLGVPFWRPGERELQRTYEHRKLRKALLEEDFDTVGALAADFGRQFPVWGWKAPAIHRHIEEVGRRVPNPHFVLVFKEILSIAARKNAMNGKDVIDRMQIVTQAYRRIAELVQQIEYPCLLVSYDYAMANLETFLVEAAAYAGMTQLDPATVAAKIREDQGVYLRGWEIGRQHRQAQGGLRVRKGLPVKSPDYMSF